MMHCWCRSRRDQIAVEWDDINAVFTHHIARVPVARLDVYCYDLRYVGRWDHHPRVN
jgi:hypothetical protein